MQTLTESLSSLFNYFKKMLTPVKEKSIYRVVSFPATCGDSFWVTYGTEKDQHHILIDGGTATTNEVIKTYIGQLPKGSALELLIVTHYDTDHIEGIRTLLSQDPLPIEIKEIWFNDYDRLEQTEVLESFGGKMGEKLSQLINKHQLPWNALFLKKAVLVPDDTNINLPTFKLAGGLKITLLSPYQKELTKLKAAWKAELELANLMPGYGARLETDEESGLERFGGGIIDFKALGDQKFNPDEAEGNGSSIAFFAEFADKRILFAGDAFSEVIIKSLDRIDRNRITVDLLKVSHHGGARNTNPALIDRIKCRHYLFSTNGIQRPTVQTMAYILKGSDGPTFYFNYLSQQKRGWEVSYLKLKYKYKTQYPVNDLLVLDILKLEN